MSTKGQEKQYVIEKRDNQWCLLSHDGSRVLGCHDSKEKAEAQERAIQVAKQSVSPENLQKLFDYLTPAMAEQAKPIAQLFDDLVKAKELREELCQSIWTLQESINSIASDSSLDDAQRKALLVTSLEQFLATAKDDVSSEGYALAEAAVKTYAKPKEEPSEKEEIPEAFSIEGVELFATGKHNGDDYSEKDLDDMVEAYAEQGYQAPLKLGHDETPGKPAVGWVANLRRQGAKLLGDITHIPKELYESIKRRGYDRVSAEIYWNLKSSGRTFRRALKAVALLGADVPAVSTLTPLHKLFDNMTGEVKFYDAPQGGKMNEKEQLGALQKQLADLQKSIAEGGGAADESTTKTLSEMGTQIKLLAKKIEEKTETEKKLLAQQEENAELSKRLSVLEDERRKSRISSIVSEVKIPAFRPYMQALLEAATEGEEKVVKFSRAGKTEDRTVEAIVKEMIGDLNKMSHGLFKEHTQGGGRRIVDGEELDYNDRQAVSNLVDNKAKAYAAQHSVKYADALRAVLDSDPQLKAAYTS